MILNENHITQHHFIRLKNKELGQIYFVMSIRSFIIALVGIFIPIYLYTKGSSVQGIALFYLIMFGAQLFIHYPASLLMARFGPKHNIAYSLPFLIFHIWQLWTMDQYGWPLWFVAITGSITLSLYWTGYHYDFSLAKSKNRANKEISKLFVIIALLSATAPFIGGYIAENYGFNLLFGLVSFSLLFAIFPLLRSADKHLKRKFSIKRIKFDRSFTKQMISVGSSAVESSNQMTVWPLYIFILFGSYQKLGTVTSAALIITVFTTYYIGKIGDKSDKCKLMRIGSRLTFVSHVLKVFTTSLYWVFGVNLLSSFAHSLFITPMYAEYYLHADENSRLEYIFLGEAAGSLLRVVYFGIIFGLGYVLSENSLLIIALLLGAISALGIGLMPNAKCELKYLNKDIKVARKLQKV